MTVTGVAMEGPLPARGSEAALGALPRTPPGPTRAAPAYPPSPTDREGRGARAKEKQEESLKRRTMEESKR